MDPRAHLPGDVTPKKYNTVPEPAPASTLRISTKSWSPCISDGFIEGNIADEKYMIYVRRYINICIYICIYIYVCIYT